MTLPGPMTQRPDSSARLGFLCAGRDLTQLETDSDRPDAVVINENPARKVS